jgi:hypothetical protein
MHAANATWLPLCGATGGVVRKRQLVTCELCLVRLDEALETGATDGERWRVELVHLRRASHAACGSDKLTDSLTAVWPEVQCADCRTVAEKVVRADRARFAYDSLSFEKVEVLWFPRHDAPDDQ